MFDILKPPTDNLYKFMALSGLLLLIVSIVASGYAVVNLEWKRLAALRELNITKEEIRQSEAVQKELDAARAGAQAALKGAEAASLDSKIALKEKTRAKKLAALKKANERIGDATKELTDAQSRLSQKSDEYSKLAKDIQMRTVDNEYQGEVLETVGGMEQISEVLGLIGGGLGILFAAFGFLLWYRKVQKFQDQILLD